MRIVLILMLFLAGCGSSMKKADMRGSMASFLNGDVVSNFHVSSHREESLSARNYELVKVYFQNTNDFWLRVKSVEVVSVDQVDSYNVIIGRDVKTWLKSMKLQLELKKEETMKKKLKWDNSSLTALSGLKEEDYLYRPFSIPSGLQSEKWLLFQVPGKKSIKSFTLKVELIDTSSQIYKVVLK